MKKRMRDDNLMKISEMADRQITETSQAIILICYLLYRVEEPVESDLLYNIAVTGGIINFFTYQEAISTMLQNQCIAEQVNEAKEHLYTVTELGITFAQKMRNYAQKSYRDQIVIAAKREILKKHNQREAVITYENVEQGCYLHVTLNDRDLKLLELTLFTPDLESAKQLGDHILANPPALYHDVIRAAMTPHEIPIDLKDN